MTEPITLTPAILRVCVELRPNCSDLYPTCRKEAL